MRDPDSRATRAGFSRRDFLKGSGAAVAATAVATQEEARAAAAQKSKVVPAEGADLTLNVNGKDYTLKKVQPRVTLLEALRNDLDITGAKDADDTTATGADTVLVDGKATLASSVFAHEAAGKKIVTVESIADGPVADGFVKHDAQQCGFCTPGFVMATHAFLQKNPGASLEEIQKGLGGNLCRCGTYHGITQCALELSQKGGA